MSELKQHRGRRKQVKAWRLAVLVIPLAAATTLGCLHQLKLAQRPSGSTPSAPSAASNRP
jgi:hypothetical protein